MLGAAGRQGARGPEAAPSNGGLAAARARGALRARGGTRRGRWRPPRTGVDQIVQGVLNDICEYVDFDEDRSA